MHQEFDGGVPGDVVVGHWHTKRGAPVLIEGFPSLNLLLPVCQEVGDQLTGGGWQAKLSELSVNVGVVEHSVCIGYKKPSVMQVIHVSK